MKEKVILLIKNLFIPILMYSIIEEGKLLNLYQRFSKEEQVFENSKYTVGIVKENGICIAVLLKLAKN